MIPLSFQDRAVRLLQDGGKLWGIVGLVKRYPRRLIDQACAQALRENVGSYKVIIHLTERLLNAAQRQQMGTPLDADLLVLDDLFLARRISDAAVEMPQSLVHQRYKLKRSIVVNSNRVVQDWGKYLGETMATTILGRLMHRAHLLEFEGKSYRLKEAANRLTGLVKQGEPKAT